MRKAICFFVALIATCGICLAETITVNDFNYELSGTTATLSGFVGDPDELWDVTIPSKVTDGSGNEYTVTSIASDVFYKCEYLGSIVIPSTITSIAESVFDDLNRIGALLLESATPPALGANNIPPVNLNEMSVIVAPASYDAYRNANGWKDFPNIDVKVDGLTYSIDNGEATLVGVDRGVTVANVLSSIDTESASYNVTALGHNAFYNARNVNSLSIPSTVTTLGGSNPFGSCLQLTTITVDAGNPKYDSRDNCNAIIETATNKLVVGSKSTIVPFTVTCIGEHAFHGLGSLASIEIPEGVTSIEAYAFVSLELKTIFLPNTLTSIGQRALATYRSIEVISYATVPPTIVGVNKNAANSTFYGTNVTLHVPVGCADAYRASYWGGVTGQIIDDVINDVVVDGLTYRIYDKEATLIDVDEDLTVINILPSIKKGAASYSVTAIGEEALYDGVNVTSVTIPATVTSLGESPLFSFCNHLATITVDVGNPKYDSRDNCNAIIETATNKLVSGCKSTIIPSSVTCIGDHAFSGCQNLMSIEIPEGVKSIEGYALVNVGLETIVLPRTLTSIGDRALATYNSNILKVISYARVPPAIVGVNKYAFKSTFYYSNVILHVPFGCADAYRASYWGGVTEQIIDDVEKPQYDTPDYLCFKAVGGDVTIGLDKDRSDDVLSLQISNDGKNWSEPVEYEADVDNLVTLHDGETCYFRRGSTEAITSLNSNRRQVWRFTMDGEGTIEAGGNIMSLLDQTCQATTAGANAFSTLFYNCTKLTKAPKLPATTLGESCYYNMFGGCSSLQEVELPMVDCSASDCLSGWLLDTADDGRLIVPLALIGNSTVSSSISSNWSLATRIKLNEDPGHKGNFYTTFYDGRYDYKVEDGFKAYSGSVNDEELRLTATPDNIIPKGDGVLIHGGSGEVLLTVSNGSAERIAGNVLTGRDNASEAPANCYILSYGQKGLGFYQYAAGKALSAHKAYLIKPAGAKALRMVFDEEDDADGISPLPTSPKGEEMIYNLQGIRLGRLQKGINIVNGKKIIVR